MYSNSDQILVGISKKQGSPEALQNAGGKGCSKEVSVGHLRWRTAYHGFVALIIFDMFQCREFPDAKRFSPPGFLNLDHGTEGVVLAQGCGWFWQ